MKPTVHEVLKGFFPNRAIGQNGEKLIGRIFRFEAKKTDRNDPTHILVGTIVGFETHKCLKGCGACLFVSTTFLLGKPLLYIQSSHDKGWIVMVRGARAIEGYQGTLELL